MKSGSLTRIYLGPGAESDSWTSCFLASKCSKFKNEVGNLVRKVFMSLSLHEWVRKVKDVIDAPCANVSVCTGRGPGHN